MSDISYIELEKRYIELENRVKLLEDKIIQMHIKQLPPTEAIEVNDCYSSILKKIEIGKIYNKQVTELKRKRNNSFENMTMDAYITLTKSHVTSLTDIFTTKGFSPKKIRSVISRGLSPMDTRLVKYENYYNEGIAIDDIEILMKVLRRQGRPESEYEPFNIESIYTKLSNYGSVISNIETNLEIALQGSLIYLSCPDGGNYSFYYLSEITSGIRYWKLDCHLERLTTDITGYLLNYLIGCFREMYMDVFSDNIYRVDYHTKCQLTECDMEQLIKNIRVLNNPKLTNTLIKNIVKNNSTHTPTDVDKFNIRSNNTPSNTKLNHTTSDIASRLFDSISPTYRDIINI
uniref:Uncharacterized protein n=1 Tax=viral metagenome TaxID=1070528 RepID=A0A6C0LVD2_9ZZZZ